MSTNPLPAISTPSPAPTASPTRSSSDSSDPSSDSAFNTHLQSAQQQSRTTTTATTATNTSSPTAQNASTSTPSKPGQNASAKAGDSDTSVSADDSEADAAGNTTLTSTVLGLIDQSSLDTSVNATPNGKAGANKPNAATNANANVSPAPQAAALIPAVITPVAMPVPAAPSAATQTSAKSGNGDSASQIGATAATHTTAATNDPNATIGSTPDKSASAFATSGNASDTTDSGADDDSSDTAAGSVLTQVLGTNAQTAMSSLPSHIAITPIDTTPATGNAPQSAPDLSALRGVLNASTLMTPAPTTSAPHTLTVDAPVNSADFAQELGQQVAWLGGQDIKQAQIRLHPQDLGQLDVKVSVDRGRVDVSFVAQHPAAAAAVQQSLDQLNHMLNGQGLSLGQATVGQHGKQHYQGQDLSSSSQSSNAANDAADESVATKLQRIAIGLVDAFA